MRKKKKKHECIHIEAKDPLEEGRERRPWNYRREAQWGCFC